MNMVNSILISVLSSVYTILAAAYCFLFGAPKLNEIVPAKTSVKDRRRVAVITGSNTGVGYATATRLVVEHGVDVILACRSRDKAVRAANAINAAAESAKVDARAMFLHPCDLSSLESVRGFSKAVHEKHSTIDILVNNAGVNNTQEGRTIDNLELIFQSNMLGHFLLTKLLFDLFPSSGEGRIVTLSSVAHHFVNCSASLDENYWKELAKLDTSTTSSLPPYLRNVVQDCMESYPPSKLATLLFAMEINKKFGPETTGKRVRAIAVNPGAVASDIWRSFPDFTRVFLRLLFLNTDQGCTTSIAAALGELPADAFYLQPYWLPESNSDSAPFPVLEMMGPYVGYRVTQPRLPLDEGIFASRRLWKASEHLTGCQFE